MENFFNLKNGVHINSISNMFKIFYEFENADLPADQIL